MCKHVKALLRSALVVVALIGPNATGAAEECQSTSYETTTPAARTNEQRVARHEKIKAKFPHAADFVFLGDSIARRFTKRFYPDELKTKRVLNLGVGGDKTQNVLWRLNDLPLKDIEPKAVFIILGTNNFRDMDSPCDIYIGIEAVVKKVKISWPRASIIVSQLLPRGKNFAFRLADRKELNRLIEAGQTHNGYKILKIDEKAFEKLDAEGNAVNVKPDMLHLTAPGYHLYADKLKEYL